MDLIDEIPRGHTEGLIDWENEQFKNETTQMDKLYIFSEEENETLLGLEELKKEYPEIKFNSLNRVLLQNDKMFKQRYSIFILAMFFISISLIIGIVISLINNMNLKRKDFAILRTLKVKPKEIILIIAIQTYTYLFLGIGIGVILANILYLCVVIMEPGTNIIVSHLSIMAVFVITTLISTIVMIPFGYLISKNKLGDELNLK